MNDYFIICLMIQVYKIDKNLFPPRRNLATPGFADENDGNGYASDLAFIFDAASRNNVEVKKKKKKGFKKVASQFKKGIMPLLGLLKMLVDMLLQVQIMLLIRQQLQHSVP